MNAADTASKSSRRIFLGKSAAAVAAAYGLTGKADLLASTTAHPAEKERPYSASLLRHRFGVNYVPSKRWYYFWNDFDADSVARDLDVIASLGVDHIRMLLIWAYFQPNRTWVSPTHLDRVEKLSYWHFGGEPDPDRGLHGSEVERWRDGSNHQRAAREPQRAGSVRAERALTSRTCRS